jgi:glycosyltransferase involved in cell wall biosynthesis
VTIDILMPFWGRRDHLELAVRSVIAQSHPDWRLVVIDDAYPDLAPGEWVGSLGDPRIEYRRNPENLGVAGNFRLAAELAQSEFATIMGCDDVMLPNYVERMVSLSTRHPDAAIIQPGVRVIDENGEPARPLGDRVKGALRLKSTTPTLYGGERLARSLLRGNWTYFPSLCWNVSYLKTYPFRADLDVVLDLALQLQIIINGGQLLLDDEVCFLYRRHSASVSSWKAVDGTRFVQEALLFRESEPQLRALGWTRAIRAARVHLTSRLNAATQLPQAIRVGTRRDRNLLIRHIVGSE